jgi:uncharacterized membrane protein YkoI
MRFILALAAAAFMQIPASAQMPQPPVIGLTRALAIAERATGGRVMEAELEYRRGKPVYEIEVMGNRGLRKLKIDADSGRLLGSSPLRLKSLWARWFKTDEYRQAGQARSLAPLLVDLERHTRGSVRDVSFDVEAGRAHYEIEIATPAGVTDLQLDALTGKRLALALDD